MSTKFSASVSHTFHITRSLTSCERLASLLIILLLLDVTAHARPTPVGTAFTYQGQLKQSGTPVNATADFQFTLFDMAAGGSPVSPTLPMNAVVVSAGLFAVDLDFGNTFLNQVNARWLEIAVRSPAGGGVFTTLAPRQRLQPTPVAQYALSAPGITLPYQGMDNLNAYPFQITANADDASAINGAASNGTGVEGFGNTGVSGNGSTGVAGNGDDIGVYGEGPIGVSGAGDQSGVYGILLQSNSGAGVFGEVNGAGPGNNTYGVHGRNPLAGGKGVYGHTTNPNSFNIGVFGQADGTDGYGVFGYAGHLTGQTYGGYFEVESTAGTGVKSWANATTGDTSGVYGISLSSSGIGVRGSAGSGTGNTVGVQGECFSPTGVGVYGEASAINTTGDNAGVKGRSFSTTGYGVAGHVSAATGLQFGVAGAGVYGQSDTPGGSRGVYGRVTAETGQNFAVFGEALTSNNWAGYFAGRCHISANLGLGVTAPAFQLHLSTNSAAKPTSNVWTISSDRRLKKNINTIEHALDDLMSLRGVTYQWIDPASQGDMTGTYTGMIAQDVEKVFPEWISEDANGFKSLTVIGFEGIVVEALRELRTEKDAQIEHLNRENADLRARNDELADRLAAIELLVKVLSLTKIEHGELP